MRKEREAKTAQKAAEDENRRKEEAMNKAFLEALHTCQRLGKINRREVREAKKRWKSEMKMVRGDRKRNQAIGTW